MVIHWFTCIFDLTIMFWMIYGPTRKWATLFCIAFHLMNSQMFSIGMFPWVCLAELPLFYEPNWPRTILAQLIKTFTHFEKKNSKKRKHRRKILLQTKNPGKTEKLIVFILLCYCAIQIILPYSHFITNGYNNWTNGIYGYSWDMMVHAWDTILVVVKVVDNGNNRTHYLNPYKFTENDRWTKHADMAYEHARCINGILKDDYYRNPYSILNSTNISIYFDVWCSLNGRFQQRMFDPNVDVLTALWSPLTKTTWIKPLLIEFTDMRSKLTAIANQVLGWNNYSDVIFVADFPELIMDNFIPSELNNVTLTVLHGSLGYVDRSEGNAFYNITIGQKKTIQSGQFHKIKTISKTPACFMYTFSNQTMAQNNRAMEALVHNFSYQQKFLYKLINHYENLKQFMINIFNAFLIEMWQSQTQL